MLLYNVLVLILVLFNKKVISKEDVENLTRLPILNLIFFNKAKDITITPVLDLTGVKKTAGEMNTLWDSPTIDPTVSTLQAASMAVVAQEQAANTATDPAIATDKAPQPIHFTQINNAPHELSTSDIYRNTRSQIALAKEELNV